MAGRTALDAVVRAIPSKSVTHRALVAAALARGDSRILHPLDGGDTRATRDGLQALGALVTSGESAWTVSGTDGAVRGGGRVDAAASGTTLRLLLAMASLGPVPTVLAGTSRLAVRPLRPLVDALLAIGARVHHPGTPDCIARAGGAPPRGGRARVAGSPSSQFASALLLVGPCLPEGLDLEVLPPVVSSPYVDLTVSTMRRFGARVERTGDRSLRVEATGYLAADLSIEGDHSAAAFFLAAAVVAGGRVRVMGLDPASTQPDARIGRLLMELGCAVTTGADWVEVESGHDPPGFEWDLQEAPDLLPVAAVLALVARGACAVRGVAHVRGKESDRLEVLAEGLVRLGRDAHAEGDRLVVGATRRPPVAPAAPLRTGSDHRIAMCWGVASLRVPGIRVEDPACVAKSHPAFWTELERLRAGRAGAG